ncbi:MAG: glycosyltransferase family 4 protein [Candidatus Thorarchaeota archaeon]
MKPRIPIVAHLISPLQVYGKEKWLLALLKHLDPNKVESIVLPLLDSNTFPLEAALRRQNYSYYPLKLSSKLSFKTINKIKSIINNRNIDILHSHDYRADFYAYMTRKTGGVARIISTPHGWSNVKSIKLQAYQLANKAILRYFNCVLPVSPHMKNSLLFVPSSKIDIIDNFVDLSSLPTPISPDKYLISYIGRLTKIKRIEDIIVALQHTCHSDVHLQIIGEGNLRTKLQRLATTCKVEDRVSFLGFRENALDLLNQSICLVIPSLTEGLSRITMEAMGMGKPVIGTNIPGISYMIKHDHSGVLVRTKNPKEIASAIDRIIGDSAFATRIGNNARDHIEHHHSAKRGAEEYTKIYKRILNIV